MTQTSDDCESRSSSHASSDVGAVLETLSRASLAGDNHFEGDYAVKRVQTNACMLEKDVAIR